MTLHQASFSCMRTTNQLASTRIECILDDMKFDRIQTATVECANDAIRIFTSFQSASKTSSQRRHDALERFLSHPDFRFMILKTCGASLVGSHSRAEGSCGAAAFLA